MGCGASSQVAAIEPEAVNNNNEASKHAESKGNKTPAYDSSTTAASISTSANANSKDGINSCVFPTSTSSLAEVHDSVVALSPAPPSPPTANNSNKNNKNNIIDSSALPVAPVGLIQADDELSQYSRPSTREMGKGDEEDADDLTAAAVKAEKKKKPANTIIDLVEEDIETSHNNHQLQTSSSTKMEERVACSECGRKFATSRIERHVQACQKRKETSSRPKFDSKAQRLGVRLAPIRSKPLPALSAAKPANLLIGVPADNE